MKQRPEHKGWDQDSETETKEKKKPEAKAVTHEDEKKIRLKRLWGWEGKKKFESERDSERGVSLSKVKARDSEIERCERVNQVFTVF